MEQHGSLERALAPIAPYLAGIIAAYALLSSLLWLAGELAGWLWTRRWPPADAATALGEVANLLRDRAHPALAWPGQRSTTWRRHPSSIYWRSH